MNDQELITELLEEYKETSSKQKKNSFDYDLMYALSDVIFELSTHCKFKEYPSYCGKMCRKCN